MIMSRNPDLMLNRSVIAQQVPAGGVAIQSKEKAGTSLNGWFGCVRFSHCFALPPMCFASSEARFLQSTRSGCPEQGYGVPDARGTLRDQAASRTLLRAMCAVIVIHLLGLPSFSSANCLYPFKPFQGSVMKS